MRFKHSIFITSAIFAALSSCNASESGVDGEKTPPPTPPPPVDDNGGDYEGPNYNVLFIMADDFNNWAKCVGYYQNSITPNVDALANKGVLFSNAYCSSPVSNPSRNALWSGYRPSTTGIQGNSDGYVREVPGFANIVTMNQYFKNNGYYVYGAGKLYHPGTMGDNETDPRNWSELNTCGTGSQGLGSTVASWSNPDWSQMTYKVGANPMTTDNCNDYNMALQVAAFIEGYDKSANSDKPFFIGCGLFRPHLPWNVSSQFWTPYEGLLLDPPQGFLENDLADIPGNNNTSTHDAVVAAGKWRESIRAYLSCMSLADYNVGILIEALNKTKYKDNTVIVFMGDHGWQLGEKKKWGKNTIYNAANATTLIIYHPGSNNKIVHRCNHPVSLQDIYPTLIDLCNLPRKTNIEGRNITQLIENPNDASWNKPVLCTYAGINYIQDRNYKYISGTTPQLYKIDTDPYEWNNLYTSATDPRVVKLKNQMDSMLNIGYNIRKDMGLSPTPVMMTTAKPLTLKVAPQSIISQWQQEKFADRKVVVSVNKTEMSLELNLLGTEAIANIYIYDQSGQLVEQSKAVGEKTVTYFCKRHLNSGKYYIIVDDALCRSIESFII